MVATIMEIYDYTTYQEVARQTCSYDPIDGSFLTYPILGAIGEIGECIEKVKKIYRDNGGEIDPSVRYALMMELGDVTWFVSCLCDELGMKLAEIKVDSMDKARWVNVSLAELAIELACLSGSLASASSLGRSNKGVLSHTVSRIFVFIHVIADRIGVPMASIMWANINKLKDRVKNGRLSGNSDYR